MKAFVTGATGFIGQNLVERLLKDNWSVTIVSRDNDKAKKIFPKKVKIISGDISNFDSFKKVKDIDIIFNLAGALPHHNSSKEIYLSTNIEGTRNLLEFAKIKKIKRFVHISTVGIYGSQKNSIYAKSKLMGENLVTEYFKKHKLPTAIIRPTIAYGPHDTRPGFKDLFQLISKNKFLIVGNGKNHFHTIYVDNLVDAIIKVATNKNAIGKDFIIGDDPCPTIEEIVQEIAKIENKKIPNIKIPLILSRGIGIVCDFFKILSLPSPLPTTRVNFITEERKYPINKAKKVLKWKPKVLLSEGLTKTYNWYVDNNFIK